MRQDFLLSVLVHLILVAALVVGSPFKPRVRIDMGDVIKVSLASLPYSATLKPQAVVIPKAVQPENQATLVPDTKTVSKAKPIDKSKPKKKETKKKLTAAEKGLNEIAGSESGTKDVTENLGVGSVFGGAAVDNAAFDYPYWFVQAFSKIERNWSNPVYANQPLTCTIYFQVIRSGKIIKIEVEKSSGIDAFDRACEQAVTLSEPLPPLPDEFTDEIIGIHLEFPYAPG